MVTCHYSIAELAELFRVGRSTTFARPAGYARYPQSRSAIRSPAVDMQWTRLGGNTTLAVGCVRAAPVGTVCLAHDRTLRIVPRDSADW